MLATRALEILSAVPGTGEVRLTELEQGELLEGRFLQVVDLPTYTVLKQEAQTLDQRQESARAALSRGSSLGSAPDRARLREAMDQVEAAAQAQARVAAMATSPLTQGAVAITERGRRVVGDLSAWQARLGTFDLDSALGWFDRLRAKLQEDVIHGKHSLDLLSTSMFLTPGALQRDMAGQLPKGRQMGFGDVDPAQRSAALLFAMAPGEFLGDPEMTKARNQFLKSNPPSPYLPTAAALSAVAAGRGESSIEYSWVLHQLAPRFGSRPDEPLIAASLLDLTGPQVEGVMTRLDWLRRDGVSEDPYVLLTLARSSLEVEVLAAKMRSLTPAIAAVATGNAAELPLAAAILAASPVPAEEGVRKYAWLYGRVGTTLAHPAIAAATLAAGPLAPNEAWFVLQEGIAAVSRGGFFDTTLEVDKLGFLLVGQLEPPEFASGREWSRAEPFLVGAAATAGFLWIARFTLFQDLPVVTDVLAHPEHAHTVAGFG